MSEFHVEVVRLGAIDKHSNADSLGITKIHGGYPVIVRLGDYQEGDLAVYVPVDSVVPSDDPRWEFLGTKTRIRAKKLRGIFSMGLLTQADPAWTLGQDVAEALRIQKYEPPPPAAGQEDDAPAPPGAFIPNYTDIEGLRRYGDVLVPGEEIVITEKLHGECMKAVMRDGRLYIASRTRWKKPDAGGWGRAAKLGDLETKLAGTACVLYGEAHGYTGGFPYGVQGAAFRAFDAFDCARGCYLNYDEFVALCDGLCVRRVPVLYQGPWDPAAATLLAEGPSTLDKNHVREGIVVKPVVERFDDRVGRVILKLHGEGFLLK